MGFIAAMFAVGAVFLPSVALTLYRSGSLVGPRLPGIALNSPSRARAVRKGNPGEIRREVPIPSRDAPARAEVQDPTVTMLLSSGSVPIPILRTAPVRTQSEGKDKAGAQYERGHSADSPTARGAWDESSEPQTGSASTTLRQAAIDAINIGVSSAGGGGHESTGGDPAGGEQGNHLQ
jgi:hypothetical protein